MSVLNEVASAMSLSLSTSPSSCTRAAALRSTSTANKRSLVIKRNEIINDNSMMSDKSSTNNESTLDSKHVSLETIRPFLTCSLCNEWINTPYTIKECLHTFCRECLQLHFSDEKPAMFNNDSSRPSSSSTPSSGRKPIRRILEMTQDRQVRAHSSNGGAFCPICKTILSADPMKNAVRIDRLKKVILDRVLKEVADNNDKQSYSPHTPQHAKRKLATSIQYPSSKKQCTQDISSSGSKPARSSPRFVSARNSVAATEPPSSAVDSEVSPPPTACEMTMSTAITEVKEMNVELQSCDIELNMLDKPFLRCLNSTSIGALQTYIMSQLSISCDSNKMDLLCVGFVLKANHTLEFVKATYWAKRCDMLQIQYRTRPTSS